MTNFELIADNKKSAQLECPCCFIRFIVPSGYSLEYKKIDDNIFVYITCPFCKFQDSVIMED